MPTPVLHLLAGPNGAGKSTFVSEILGPVTHLGFVNADLIAAERWPDDPQSHAYDASAAAAERRDGLLRMRRSFITETVFSHPSKLDLVGRAASLGYRVILHVIVVPVELSVARVSTRVEAGGHHVPRGKIRERYTRLWPLVVEAAAIADEATFYDNTSASRPFRRVARMMGGRFVEDPEWPQWAPAVLRSVGLQP